MSEKVYFGKGDITPDFLNPEKDDSEKIYREKVAKNALKNLEETAEKKNPENSEKITSKEKTKNLEDNFKYTGSGKSVADRIREGKKTAKSLKNSRLKKGLPLFAILGAIIVAVFFMFASIGSLGNQIELLITRATDTMFGSYSENTLRTTEELLAGKRGNFPEYFEERLEAQGITVNGSHSGYTLGWDGNSIDSENFRDTFKNDIAFREAFTKAKRGRTSNFYDKSAMFAFTRIGASRNLYRNYRQTGDNNVDTKNYKKVGSDLFDNGTNVRTNTVTERQKTDENGKPITDSDGNPVYEKAKSGDDIVNSMDGNSTSKARSFLMDNAGRVADITSVSCAALKVANMVSVAVASAEIYQAIHYFLYNIETVGKTKNGEGSATAMNQFLNFLSEPVTSKYVDVESGEEKEVIGAPIEAEGFANALTGTTPDLKKTRNYSVESAFLTSGFAIGLSTANNQLCGGMRAVGAVASIAVGIFGGGIVKSVVSLAKTTLINFALQQGIMTILSALIPRIAQSLFENTAETLSGIPAGETFVKGAALNNKKVARSSNGQLLADKETAISYNTQTKIANASEAELNRRNADAFDASNPDTFLGSIVIKLSTISSGNSFLKSISSFSNITKNSLASILNRGASALATSISDPGFETDVELAGTDYLDVFSDESTCERLTSIGAACGTYGEEIPAVDPDIMTVSSDDPKYLSIINKNTALKSDGTREVKPNSLLAHKTMFCDERDSPFGVYDANIANAFQTSLGFADNIPVLNDVIDLVNAVEEMSPETEGWATGAYCVMNASTNPYYEELLYLQHYNENARIATQLELDEVRGDDGIVKNPTLAYKEAWYEINPIDTSTAGLLARYTGTTKKDAEDFIALIEYYDYLANYTPPTEEKEEEIISFKTSEFVDFFTNIMHKSEYADLRTRSFAA
ncbi:hypothetical protein IJI76_01665 [Candidatus Saccharibacteria bacterium]|nr:hypothetical protein [Candidatus Saccharibacteria bacterium]